MLAQSKIHDMKYVSLSDKDPIISADNPVRRLSFYLSMEEYVARSKPATDYFFMWQVNPSVIFGRNQLIENEVNLEYCRQHNIMTYRRKSGGGCVYADLNNIMFSYITGDDSVGFTYNRYINMVVRVLRQLGVDAKASGRNDVLIGDRKVSGNAFYKIPGRSIVHGTMLYDTDMANMVGAITPSNEKLVSKGVESVRQRIALLKDYTDISIDEFKLFVKNNLCDSELRLTQSDIEAIEELERQYLSDEFIYGNNPKYTISRKCRIDGVGDFDIRIEMKNDTIADINIMGDFFLAGDMDAAIVKPLRGVKLDRQCVRTALTENVDSVIVGLSRPELVEMIIGAADARKQ